MNARFNRNDNRFPIEIVIEHGIPMIVSLTMADAMALNKSLDEAIEAARATFAPELLRTPALTWKVEGTGGGCDALMAHWNDGIYCLITEPDDPSVPESEDAECGLGVYNDDGEPLHWAVYPNTAAAKQAAAAFLIGGHY